jgi:hypothetical protein
MKACPLEFQHPSQAQQLNGLGPKLCDRLTDKLKAYCEENGLPMPEPPDKGKCPSYTLKLKTMAHQALQAEKEHLMVQLPINPQRNPGNPSRMYQHCDLVHMLSC